jgi:hypothetical protein
MGLTLVLGLSGCNLPPSNTPPPTVNNLEKAKIFNTGAGRVLSPEEAKKKREESTIDPTVVEERDDIVSVQQFWNPQPWLTDSASRPVGFRVPIYLLSGQTEKGAFAPGTILAWMYLVDPAAPAGSTNRQPLYVWEMPRNDAMGFRVRKKTMMGYFYGFLLKWPETINVAGETIEIEFGYERLDKRVVLGTPQRFKVPVPPGTPRKRPQPPAAPPVAQRPFSDEEIAALRRQVAKSPRPSPGEQPETPTADARTRQPVSPASRPSE